MKRVRKIREILQQLFPCLSNILVGEHQYLGEAAKLLPDDERDSIKSQITVYWCVQFPFSLYLGWISVATIANVAVTLVYYGINTWDSGTFFFVRLRIF